jgi:hypothetical protein
MGQTVIDLRCRVHVFRVYLFTLLFFFTLNIATMTAAYLSVIRDFPSQLLITAPCQHPYTDFQRHSRISGKVGQNQRLILSGWKSVNIRYHITYYKSEEDLSQKELYNRRLED